MPNAVTDTIKAAPVDSLSATTADTLSIGISPVDSLYINTLTAAETDTLPIARQIIMPVDSALKGGRRTYSEVETFSKPQVLSKFDTYTNMGLMILLLAFFIISTERIIEGVFVSFRSMFSLRLLKETDENQAPRVSRTVATLFLILIFSFIMAYLNCSNEFMGKFPVIVSFGIVAVGLLAYLLFKALVLKILDYVNEVSVFSATGRMLYGYVTVALTTCLISSLLLFIIPSVMESIIIPLTIVCVAIPVILYLTMASKMIFRAGFSIFFYILYLCCLEILPIVLIVKVISNL